MPRLPHLHSTCLSVCLVPARKSSRTDHPLVIQSSQCAQFAHSNFGSPQTGNYFGNDLQERFCSLSVPAVDFRKGPRKQQVRRDSILRPRLLRCYLVTFLGSLTLPLPSNRTDKMKFLKTSRVCLVTRGRYAGKKVRESPRTSVFFSSCGHRIQGTWGLLGS